MTEPKHTVVIVESSTGEVVKEFDVTGKSDRHIDRLMAGMSINLDHESFYVDERKPADA